MEEQQDTRQRILNAAEKLFGEIGYKRASTRAIATEAGVNEITLFRHFGTKQNLLKAFVEEFNASGFAANFQNELTGDYATDILIMARAQIAEIAARFKILRLMMCDLMELPEMREVSLAGAQQNATLITAYFQRQIDNGVIRPDLSATTLSYAFDGLFSTAIVLQFLFNSGEAPVVPENLLQELIALFVQGTIRKELS